MSKKKSDNFIIKTLITMLLLWVYIIIVYILAIKHYFY